MKIIPRAGNLISIEIEGGIIITIRETDYNKAAISIDKRAVWKVDKTFKKLGNPNELQVIGPRRKK